MKTETSFIEILEKNKNSLNSLKKIILENRSLINKEFEIKKNSEIFIHSPLSYCIENKLCELSIFLIEQGANINYKTSPNEDTPILIACRYGLEDIVKKLLLYDNLDINCINKDNETCYTILLNKLNISIYNIIRDYASHKNSNNENKNSNTNKKSNVNNTSNNIKEVKNNNKEIKRNINNKRQKLRKKIIGNNISFEIPIEYNDIHINSKFGKFFFII